MSSKFWCIFYYKSITNKSYWISINYINRKCRFNYSVYSYLTNSFSNSIGINYAICYMNIVWTTCYFICACINISIRWSYFILYLLVLTNLQNNVCNVNTSWCYHSMSILCPSYCSRWICTRSVVIIICFTTRFSLCCCISFNSYCIIDLSNSFLCSERSC